MGTFGRSKLWGPAAVALAIIVGATVAFAFSAAGAASPTASREAATAACVTPPPPPPPPPPVGTIPPTSAVTTTTTTTTTTAPCPPTLTATPSAELGDGQIISVVGAGFTPNSEIGIAECEAGVLNISDCDLDNVGIAESDDTGGFSIEYSVARIINISNDDGTSTNVDCALTPCLLGAADVANYAVNAEAAIGFNPSIPPELTGTFAPTDPVNTTKGTATIAGTVTCTEPTVVEVSVELQQVYHRRFNFTNEAYTTVNCKARKKGSKWAVPVPPGNGYFGAGKATVQIELSADIGPSYRTFDLAGNVVLQAKTS
jgi:hypothetical protein